MSKENWQETPCIVVKGCTRDWYIRTYGSLPNDTVEAKQNKSEAKLKSNRRPLTTQIGGRIFVVENGKLTKEIFNGTEY